MSGKYEKKFNKEGLLETVKQPEIPKFNMPTEVRQPGFIPEGEYILLDIIPLEEKLIQTESLPGRKGENFVVTGETTESGIITSAASKSDRVTKGIVVAVGTDITNYSIGDVVIYMPNPAVSHLMEIEGHVYLLTIKRNLVGKYKNYDLGFINNK